MNIITQQTVQQNKIGSLSRISNSASVNLAIVLLTVGLLVPCAKAATTVNADDQAFMLAATQGGMTEVKLGELASQKGTRADVKEFGQMMVKDHTAINTDMKALAAQKGVTLPDSLDAKHQKMVDKMAAFTGAKFDDAYIAGMIKDHKEDVKAFKDEAVKTKDAAIKSFLDKFIPTVEAHLKHIKAMKK